MKAKNKVLLTSIASIALCSSLAVGGTYALFTSESKVNIAVTAGKVNVVAEILQDSLTTSSALSDYTATAENGVAKFENGGTAIFTDTDGVAQNLALENVTPGDVANFKIKVTNNSNVDIQYRFTWAIYGDLSEVLEATVNGKDLVNNTTNWEEWTIPTDQTNTQNFDVVVSLPIETSNAYQEKTAEISFFVEAVQGNASVSDADDPTAKAIYTAADLLALSGKQVEGKINIMKDIDLDGAEFSAIAAPYGKTLTVNGNGYTISNTKIEAGTHNGMNNYGLFYAFTDSTLTINNLLVENVTINATKSNFGAGIILGYTDGGSNVTLKNVDVKNSKVLNNVADIGDEAGVYVGYQTGTLTMIDCDSVGCTVAGETDKKTGAFIGMVNGTATLTNCTTDLTIGVCNRIAKTLVVDGAWYVSDEATLLNVLKQDAEIIDVTLLNNIDCNLTTGIGTANTKIVNIKGASKDVTLNITCASASYNGSYVTFRTVNPDAVMNFSNITLDKAKWTATTWNTYNIEFYTDVTLTDCVINHAVTFCEKAVVKNTDIIGYGAGGEAAAHYAVWVQANADVEIYGGTITGNRGIKADNEYITEETATKLLVEGTKFVTSGSKPAILVKLAMAEITVNGIDITGVETDSINPVWIDAEAPESGKVVVTVDGKVLDNATINESNF